MKSILFLPKLFLLLLLIENANAQTWLQGWNTLGVADYGYCIKPHISGHLYATGSVSQCTVPIDTIVDGGFIAKYNTDGTLVWARPAGSDPVDFAFDLSGNICVTGRYSYNSYIGDTLPPITGGNNPDIFIAKFDTAGNLLFARTAGGVLGENSNGITADSYNNIYITGSFVDTCYFDSDTIISRGGQNEGDIFIAKYDSTGNFTWARSAGGRNDYENGQAIDTDGSGNIYFTGTFRDTAYFGSIMQISSGLSDIFVAKYDASGTPVWVRNDGVSFNLDQGLGIYTDVAGNSYVAENYNNKAGVSKYTTAGTIVWQQIAQSGILQSGKDVTVDAAGNIYLTGHFQQELSWNGSGTILSHGSADVFVVKFNSIGNFESFITGGGTDYDQATSIAVDDSGMVYSTGSFTGFGTFGNLTLVALDSIYQSAYFLKSGMPITTYVTDVNSKNNGVVFPVPANDFVNIQCITSSVTKFLIVYSVEGIEISRYEAHNQPSTFRIDVTEFKNGMYFYSIQEEEIINKGKFIVIH